MPATQTVATFRCTRADFYKSEPMSERDGYMVAAASPIEAARAMHKRFPGGTYFDIETETGVERFVYSLTYFAVRRAT